MSDVGKTRDTCLGYNFFMHRRIPVAKTMVEERPWPEYLPSSALTTPCEAVAMPPIRQRKTQKMEFSRSDMSCFLVVEGRGRSVVDCYCE